ncbi:MAG: sialate O-acetylesterase [Chitinophagaceae bacterium]
MLLRLLTYSLLLLSIAQVKAQTSLPTFFSDSMVMQQQSNAAIWGTDAPNSKIVVKASWGKRIETTCNNNGKWKVNIPTPIAGGPYRIEIKGKSKVVLNNILIGEVWLCSGQSNMEMTVRGNNNQPIIGNNETILQSTNQSIRVFQTQRNFSRTAAEDTKGKWSTACPTNTGNFSAVAYFFAKKIHSVLGIPVGIIQTSWGNSIIESWMDSATLASFKPVKISNNASMKDANQTHTMLYNSMIHPFVGFTIKGMLWYQGESNQNNAKDYSSLLKLTVDSWRNQWQQGLFPFYYVQIAPHAGTVGTLSNALLREAQMKSLNIIENSGMAITMDVGEQNMVHPAQKEIVGTRLAYWAFAKEYKIQGIEHSGPIFKQIEKIVNDSIVVSFDYANLGLTTFGKPLSDFEIAGEDKVFYPAKAMFTRGCKNCITVWNEDVKNPISVRYAFKNWVQGSLYNTQALPASSFRTDTW